MVIEAQGGEGESRCVQSGRGPFQPVGTARANVLRQCGLSIVRAEEWCRVDVQLFTGSRLCEVRWLGHVSPFPGLFSLT